MMKTEEEKQFHEAFGKAMEQIAQDRWKTLEHAPSRDRCSWRYLNRMKRRLRRHHVSFDAVMPQRDVQNYRQKAQTKRRCLAGAAAVAVIVALISNPIGGKRFMFVSGDYEQGYEGLYPGFLWRDTVNGEISKWCCFETLIDQRVPSPEQDPYGVKAIITDFWGELVEAPSYLPSYMSMSGYDFWEWTLPMQDVQTDGSVVNWQQQEFHTLVRYEGFGREVKINYTLYETRVPETFGFYAEEDELMVRQVDGRTYYYSTADNGGQDYYVIFYSGMCRYELWFYDFGTFEQVRQIVESFE